MAPGKAFNLDVKYGQSDAAPTPIKRRFVNYGIVGNLLRQVNGFRTLWNKRVLPRRNNIQTDSHASLQTLNFRHMSGFLILYFLLFADNPRFRFTFRQLVLSFFYCARFLWVILESTAIRIS